MSQPTPTRPNAYPQRGTLYCLFQSIQSFRKFQEYHHHQQQQSVKQPRYLQEMRKTQQTSSQPNEQSQSSLGQLERIELTPIPKVSNIHHCQKCLKELMDEEGINEVCQQCTYMSKLIESGNFQKFVHYLLEFKTKPQSASKREYKLRRIDSIESIQSFTLDKLHDSHRSHLQYFHLGNNGGNSLKNTVSETKKSEINDSMVQGGYYCNQCRVEPIRGRRFHCLTCEDYDLCERCYFYSGHKHQMKTFKDIREQIAQRTREAVRRSQTMKNTLPFLSQSIRDFEKASRLFRTTALKNY